ncbi:unnamed protein product [Symbiodinium sp. KB8]|nr:unnamed protein product [Symbiodinium sp. KB8]
MASALPQRPVSLAQSLHENDDILDGAITFEEAISNTEGLKVIFLEKPMIVHKSIGSVKIGDLPAKDEIVDSSNKKNSDLPEPIKMNGNNLTPYTMQLFMLQSEDKTWNIVKHIRFAEGTKILWSTIVNMSTGRPVEIDYQKNFRDGTRALQYMLEGLGGFQVRYQKLVPLNASNKIPKETEDIRKGFQCLKQHGPQENSDGQFTSWTEEQVNNPDSILYKWDRGTIKEFLRCQADKGAQADTISDWPLTLADFTPWALNTVFAPLLPYLIEHAVIWIGKSEISSLDYFRKERGRRNKPRVFDDGNFYLETPAAVKESKHPSLMLLMLKLVEIKQVPYQRHIQGGGFLRKDQTKWHRNIQQLLKATDSQILKMLTDDKFIPKWEGSVCPFCEKGVLGPLTTRSQRESQAYRCNEKACHKFVSPLHLHPVFTMVRGPEVPKATVFKFKLPLSFFVLQEFP